MEFQTIMRKKKVTTTYSIIRYLTSIVLTHRGTYVLIPFLERSKIGKKLV